jgi:transcriptional regulator with XRE-family HTH domain
MAPTLAAKLRSLRIGSGMTLDALAASSGVSVRGISDIERGRSACPHPRTLDALGAALRLDAETNAWLWSSVLVVPSRQGQGIPPAPTRDFVGRADELAQLTAILSATAPTAAVVTGPPGIGKTALIVEALALSSSSRHRVFLDMAGLDREEQSSAILQSILAQCGHDHIPTNAALASSAWERWCAQRSTVVHVENVTNEDQLRIVQGGDPDVIVASSRRRLSGLPVTKVLLGPLDDEAARKLLESSSAFDARDEVSLRALLAACAGLPLALRIVANRLSGDQLMTADDLVSRMGPDRHHVAALVAGDLSLSAALQASYCLLSTRAAALFRSIGSLDSRTFAIRDVTEASGEDEWRVIDGLDEIAEVGLIEPMSGLRYRALELVRLYACGLSEE